MKFLPALVLVCASVLPLSASAQWQWLDNAGKKVFSDQAPPRDVPEKNILRRPGNAAPRVSIMDAPASAPASTTTAPATPATAPADAAPAKPVGVDPELEEKARQAEAAEKAKQEAEKQKLAKARADNCARARQNKATMDSGIRIARVNAKGEREVMDDQARATELGRVQQVINQDCK